MMGSKRHVAVVLVWSAMAVVSPMAAEGPPVAAVRDVVDTIHGVEVHDPYRWFEKRDDPELQKWTKGQAEFAASWLGRLPMRDELLDRMRELEKATGPEVKDVMATPGGYVYLKRQPGESVSKLFRRDSAGKEAVLVDPTRFAKGDQPPSIDYFTISPDGKMVSVGISR